jgi:hypothetical protein
MISNVPTAPLSSCPSQSTTYEHSIQQCIPVGQDQHVPQSSAQECKKVAHHSHVEKQGGDGENVTAAAAKM